MDDKKTIFSGIQPSGQLSIGNYLGALRNWVDLQDKYNCFYCIVDMHAITVRQNPAELRKRSIELLALYLACGIDPEKNTLFIQSHVSAHAELAWALGCFTMFGELSRMTQFKDKSISHAENINAGLFTYPVLMAADILLYQADLVPVGQDQKQHLELSRDIAKRFNTEYSDTFTIPEPFIPKEGTKIMSLSDPSKKMSKSDVSGGSIFMYDTKDVIISRFKRAVTDSGCEIKRGEGKDGINNLISIYSAFSGLTADEVEKQFDGRGYGEFKIALGELCAEKLLPIQEECKRYLQDKALLNGILTRGAEKAAYVANKTLSKVYRKLGFYSAK